MALQVPFVPLAAPAVSADEEEECREPAARLLWPCQAGGRTATLLLLAAAALLVGLSRHGHVAAGGSGAAEPVDFAIVEPVTAWFFVRHDMKPGQAGAYWKAEGRWKPQEFNRLSAEAGFHIHSLMPVSREGPIFSIWEGKAGTSAHGLEEFLDAEVGGFLMTEVFLIDARLLTGPLGASAFLATERGPAAALPDGGPAADPSEAEIQADLLVAGGESRFAVVQGDFKEGKAPSYWRVFLPPDFSYTPENKRKAMAPLIKMGFYVSAFMPISVKGPIFAVWEIKAGIDDVGFQQFLDTNLGEWMTFVTYDVNTTLTAGHTPFPRHLGIAGSTTAA